MAHVHREPYVTLAGLTETGALITWGAFFFNVDSEQLDGRFKLVEDRDLTFLVPPRKTTIGESSEPYGPATVRVWEKGGAGEVRTDPLDAAAQQDGVAWSPEPHFILCEYEGGKLTVTPYGELKDNQLKPLADPLNHQFQLPPLTRA